MQRTRLKELITQLEELLSELKVEVYADANSYIDSDGEQWYSGDDDDGYPDWIWKPMGLQEYNFHF